MVLSKLNIYFIISIATLLFFSCNNYQHNNNTVKNVILNSQQVKDTHTLSNADSIDVEHLDLDIDVNMNMKIITGSAQWTINNKNKLKELKLDTYQLSIDSLQVDNKKVSFNLDSPIKYLGSALHIPISENSKTVKIYYKTGVGAHALQWLDPAQTHDKKHQFLFTI